MKRRCFLRITKPTVLSVQVKRAAAWATPVGACDPGINAKEGAFHPATDYLVFPAKPAATS